ncbi:hypothetical protein D3C85_1331030 [compost metagenome]
MRSSGLSRNISVQRARIMAGMLGRLPASAAKTNRTQSGAFQCTLADRPISAMTQTPAARGSTLPWPWRSTRREMRGASNAVAKANVAATAPARV